MCWNLPAVLSNTVDIFRGLTNKKKPKYNGIPSKCGILVLIHMIVGIKTEWLAFGFLSGGLVFVTDGEYQLLFLKFCFSFFVASALASVKADIRTFKVNCRLDKSAWSKDLMFKNMCDHRGCNRVILEICKVIFGSVRKSDFFLLLKVLGYIMLIIFYFDLFRHTYTHTHTVPQSCWHF